jgi:hypothetical protein
MVPLTNILAGEVIVGGVGAGLYDILVFAILTIFVAGLVVGRAPAYLGKKIEARDVKLAVVAILAPPLAILIGTAFAASTDWGRATVQGQTVLSALSAPRRCWRLSWRSRQSLLHRREPTGLRRLAGARLSSSVGVSLRAISQNDAET